ncbi:hypothetical protein D9M71_842690 [compost metagenome]
MQQVLAPDLGGDIHFHTQRTAATGEDAALHLHALVFLQRAVALDVIAQVDQPEHRQRHTRTAEQTQVQR